MPKCILIADSGSTKTVWCLLKGKSKKLFQTQGMSPYFVDKRGIMSILKQEVLPQLKRAEVNEIYWYGTGCKNPDNRKMLRDAMRPSFDGAAIQVSDDLTGAALALCGKEKGIACILGTGCNSCFFNGKKIVKNSPGLGYILGDEGSGTFLGKMVIQHYVYGIFDEDLRAKFDAKFVTTPQEILNAVYKGPLPNRYLAGYAIFLAENRGHYMIENIIEDGINQFFFTHLLRYKESEVLPIHFTGGIAYGFKDKIAERCAGYGFRLGNIIKTPMEGLVEYHRENW